MAFCLEILILGKKRFTIHGQSRRGVLSGYVFVEVSTKYYFGFNAPVGLAEVPPF